MVSDHPGRARGLLADFTLHRGDLSLELALEVNPGQTVALIGPNGAGKSTIATTLSGLLGIDRGRIALGDQIWDDPAAGSWVPPHQRRIGMVFQDYRLFEHLNVAQNVAFGPRAAGRARVEAERTAHALLDKVGLGDLGRSSVGELSGGQAQRVAIARALATDPALLVLDEPLSALDVAARADLRRMLGEHLAAFGGPRLLITHEPTEAFLMADQVWILEGGVVVQHGTPEEIRARPATPYVAAVAGQNLLRGTNAGGSLSVADSAIALTAADTNTEGPVLITIAPNAVALHRERPEGSPRNAWATEVAHVEPMGDVTRVFLGLPLALSVDITPAAAEALPVIPGQVVWASVKATEITLQPT